MADDLILMLTEKGKIICQQRNLHVPEYESFLTSCNVSKPRQNFKPIAPFSSQGILSQAANASFRVVYRKGYHFHLPSDSVWGATEKGGSWAHHFTDNVIYLSKPKPSNPTKD